MSTVTRADGFADPVKVGAALQALAPVLPVLAVVQIVTWPDPMDWDRVEPGDALFTWGGREDCDEWALMLPSGRLDIGGGCRAPRPGEYPLYDAVVAHNRRV